MEENELIMLKHIGMLIQVYIYHLTMMHYNIGMESTVRSGEHFPGVDHSHSRIKVENLHQLKTNVSTNTSAIAQ